MDTKTPPIPLKHQERKEQHHHQRKDKSTEPVVLPPLTPVPNRQQQQYRPKNSCTSIPWTRGPPFVDRNSDHQKRRPYKYIFFKIK